MATNDPTALPHSPDAALCAACRAEHAVTTASDHPNLPEVLAVEDCEPTGGSWVCPCGAEMDDENVAQAIVDAARRNGPGDFHRFSDDGQVL